MRHLLVCVVLLCGCNNGAATLLFPPYSVLQFSAGIAVPAKLAQRSINLNAAFVWNRDFPSSLKDLSPVTYARALPTPSLDIDRATLYMYMANIIDSLGMDGNACVLRAICEAAHTPFYRADANRTDGADVSDFLLEAVLHFVLTPSEDGATDAEWNDVRFNDSDRFVVAEYFGRAQESCDSMYDCHLSLLDLFSSVFE